MDVNEFVPVLSPGNDLSFVAKLWKPSGTGKVALTPADGTAAGWISIAPATDTPADPVLTADVEWLADAVKPELWRVFYNATDDKDAALLAVVAGAPDVYLVVKHSAGVRRVALLEYRAFDYFQVS